MELKSTTFYFEGYEIDKKQAIRLLEEYEQEERSEGSNLTLDDYIEDLCYYGKVDIPDKGVVSLVTEAYGLPDEFDFDNAT